MRNIQNYLNSIKYCENKKNFGGSCWECCPFRENGCCELSESEGIQLVLNELFPNHSFTNESILWELLDMYSNTNTNTNKKVKKAIVSGSYDPFTNGHLSIVKQAAEMFDEVHVVIFINSSKQRTYNVTQMVHAIKETLKLEGITNCIVTFNSGLLAEYCKENDIHYTIRGLRNNIDYNYEENIVEVNKLLNDNLETIYLRSNDNKISSSTVRELKRYGKDISKYVPKPVLDIELKGAMYEY